MAPQTAFGGMLRHLAELTSLVLRPEPLDTEIERRCKQAWEETPCPECGETAIQTGDGSPRVWCTNCRYVFTYTRNTPFEGYTLTPGEVVIAFVLYADTLRVLRAEPGAQPEELKPALNEVEISRGNSTRFGTTDGADTRHSSTTTSKPSFAPKNSLRMTAFTSTRSNASGHS